MRLLISCILIVVVLSLAPSSQAAEFGTEEEAKAMVKKAILYIKEVGREKALAEFSNPKGKFIDRDLYIFVYDMNGTVLAHGQNPKLIGKNLYGVKDADGKEYVKERIELVKAKGSGWQEYKFMNPISKKIERKRAYLERYEDMIIGCGAYPKN